MTGNSLYRGRDRILPANWHYTIATVLMIVIPSFPTQCFIPFILAGWAGGTFLALVYLVSLANVLRILYLCASVEPGILPKLSSKVINCERPYKVAYDARAPQDTPANYFSVKKFKISPEGDLTD